jgi:hypothetical protein
MPSVLPSANANRKASEVTRDPDASMGTTSIKLAAPVRPCTTPTRNALRPIPGVAAAMRAPSACARA